MYNAENGVYMIHQVSEMFKIYLGIQIISYSGFHENNMAYYSIIGVR